MHNIVLTRAFLILAALCLCACDRWPDSYPPPEQRAPLKSEPLNPVLMLEMNDPDVEQHLVKDIYPRGGDSPWRWAGQQPTVKTLILDPENLKLSADFAFWDGGFKATGPVEATFLVNGRTLEKVRYTTPGEKHFEKQVPAGWLVPNSEALLTIALDKVYVSPEDGFRAGIILVRMGFVH